jgi:hypothetical protein
LDLMEEGLGLVECGTVDSDCVGVSQDGTAICATPAHASGGRHLGKWDRWDLGGVGGGGGKAIPYAPSWPCGSLS